MAFKQNTLSLGYMIIDDYLWLLSAAIFYDFTYFSKFPVTFVSTKMENQMYILLICQVIIKVCDKFLLRFKLLLADNVNYNLKSV